MSIKEDQIDKKSEDVVEESKEDQQNDSDLNNLTYAELLEKVKSLKEDSLRSAAELENFKRRTSNELSNALKYANTELLISLVPIITSLEKAIENTGDDKKIDKEGILLILDSFEKTLENFKIVPINPSGQEFDPELHEAVSTVNESGEKDNFIAKTLERGWSLNGRVVKPALVVVNKK